MFLYKNLFFSISSVNSIPIMLIGINGGYFPAICRVCLFFFTATLFWHLDFFFVFSDLSPIGSHRPKTNKNRIKITLKSIVKKWKMRDFCITNTNK